MLCKKNPKEISHKIIFYSYRNSFYYNLILVAQKAYR